LSPENPRPEVCITSFKPRKPYMKTSHTSIIFDGQKTQGKKIFTLLEKKFERAKKFQSPKNLTSEISHHISRPQINQVRNSHSSLSSPIKPCPKFSHAPVLFDSQKCREKKSSPFSKKVREGGEILESKNPYPEVFTS
jgi:hypothetical protein